MWNGFIIAISWITICLGWKTGNDKSIKIGIDPIAGLTSDYILPEDLRLYLEDYGISYLSNAHNWGFATTSAGYWLTVDELYLGGHWKTVWTQYINGLRHGGICIGDETDTLVWMFNKMTGSVKANLMYDLIANISVTSRLADSPIQIWKFHIPQKIICFSWLCLSNWVHTWDNLIKKGWIGPHWCCLCKKQHLNLLIIYFLIAASLNRYYHT